MTSFENIRGVLFDSGDTLVRPIGGAWFPGHRFDEIVSGHCLSGLDRDLMDTAIPKGLRYLNENHHLTTAEEEVEQFQTFYDILLRGLGIGQPSDDLTLELAKTMVDQQNMEPFPDTREGLERLKRRGLTLGVLSDTWPSMESKYRALGLRDYFGAFVMSAVEGRTKPDPVLFRKAIEDMDIPPKNILFVDDSARNVEGARAVGMQGALIARYAPPTDDSGPWVADLAELEALVR